MEGGALVGKGSYGCVFKPSLQCKNDTSKTKNDMNKVSKVFLSEDAQDEANEELSIDDNIRNIKGYDEWSNIWDSKCKPNKYHKIIKKEPELDECITYNSSSIYEFDKYRYMLNGTNAGISLKEYINKTFKSNIFSNVQKFKQEFLTLMISMKSLFIGLNELHKNGIGHNDIKVQNIMYHNNKFKYIDFGLSCKYTNITCFKERSISEFLNDRIYIPYSYEYIYAYVDRKYLKDEIYYIKHNDYRGLHSRYLNIHENIFNRKNTDENLLQLIELVNKKKVHKKKIISLLDTYSLGVLIPGILYKYSSKYNKKKQLLKHLQNPTIKPFIELFKDMSEPYYYNRLTPSESYSRYLELEELYLQKKRKKSNRKPTKKKPRRKLTRKK